MEREEEKCYKKINNKTESKKAHAEDMYVGLCYMQIIYVISASR